MKFLLPLAWGAATIMCVATYVLSKDIGFLTGVAGGLNSFIVSMVLVEYENA